MSDAKPIKLGPSTWLPIGVVVFMITGTMWATFYVTSWMSTVNESLRNMTRAIGASVTRTEFKLWSSELKIQNPQINVPDPQKSFTETKKNDDVAGSN